MFEWWLWKDRRAVLCFLISYKYSFWMLSYSFQKALARLENKCNWPYCTFCFLCVRIIICFSSPHVQKFLFSFFYHWFYLCLKHAVLKLFSANFYDHNLIWQPKALALQGFSRVEIKHSIYFYPHLYDERMSLLCLWSFSVHT